jgi:hypothetical protein
MTREITVTGTHPDGTVVIRKFIENGEAIYETIAQYAEGLEASKNYVEVEVKFG